MGTKSCQDSAFVKPLVISGKGVQGGYKMNWEIGVDTYTLLMLFTSSVLSDSL